MDIRDRIAAFEKLGEKIQHLSDDEIQQMADGAIARNGWFTIESIQNALAGIAFMLDQKKLEKWTSSSSLNPEVPKIVGIVMAGNIPLVGFHDLLSVLISGHFAAIKPSSDDEVLTRTIVDWIITIEPRFKKNLEIRDKLTGVDAVIATGSDNTARYFEYYFKNIPSIIRKNRISVAILTGDETEDELAQLGADIFTYFGLGCRNVSKLFTPVGFDLKTVFPHFESFSDIIHHHKYRNNYDYYKSIYLVNKTPHLDTGFLLITSTDDLVSPIGVLFHQEYKDTKSLTDLLSAREDKLQCIVGAGHIPFGTAQKPEPWDYADNVDTLEFLSNI